MQAPTGRACAMTSEVTLAELQGELAAFARERDWEKFHTPKNLVGGTVTHTFVNAALARRLWGINDSGQTWELMFSLGEVRALDLPYAELNAVVGYAPNNVVQGFTTLDDDKSAALFDYLGLDSDAHPPRASLSDYGQVLDTLGGPTERTVTAAQRVEQAYLRRHVMPGSDAECALCGQVFSVEFLVAAHIKKRAACGRAEKLDVPAIAMAACKFGCDYLFEAGYVAVDDTGRLRVSRQAPSSGRVADYMTLLSGRRIRTHGDRNARYFRWHWTHTFRQ